MAQVVAADTTDQPMYMRGNSIFGYTLVRRLGAGGMGEIWEAVRHKGDLELRVALKVAFAHVLAEPEGKQLYAREAALSGTLRHPNIAGVIDADLDRGIIVYELVDGADLRAVLDAAGGTLPLPALVSVLCQVARGLGHAHHREVGGQSSPVIHRDLSPGNVVVDYDGNVKIVDFGVAKAIAGSDLSKSVRGKLVYMAPEQADGHAVDSRSDQYALGVIGYEALAGTRPNDGAHESETLSRLLLGKHAPLQDAAPTIPSGIAQTIERMLALRPEDRFATMEAVIDAFEPFNPPLAVHRQLAALVSRARPRHTILRRNGEYHSIPIADLQSRPPRLVSGSTRSTTPAAPASAHGAQPGQAAHRGRPSDPSPARATAEKLPAPQPVGRPQQPRQGRRSKSGQANAQAGAEVRLETLPMAAHRQGETDRGPAPPKSKSRSRLGLAAAAVLAAIGATVWAGVGQTPRTALGPNPVQVIEQASQSAINGNVPSGAAGPPDARTGHDGPSTRRPIPGAISVPREPASDDLHGIQVGAAVPDSPPQPTAEPAAQVPPSANPVPTPAGRASLPRTGHSPSVAQTRARATRRTHGSERRAVLHVSVFPPTNVWIDGKKKGRSPLEVEVRPGKHQVGAGERAPVVRRRVTVGAGETEKIFLELRNQPVQLADSPTP